MGSGWGGGEQGGCEWRSEAFVKIQKKIFFWGVGVGGRVREGSGWGCQGGWEWRIEAFVKIKKKFFFSFFFLGGGGGRGVGGRRGGRRVWGQGRCEQRSKVFHKKN